ncbi:MAG: tRNA preQ1(34) S-adenosylmethionine ribosyltransferase-isomerase QueA [Acidobacteria bacterium]|nr:tRNA preQ1(34) S-adenosylmethionine ribosyltransferase-isomerase QueA [Acidobacteriota bacterium]
MKLEEFDYDLPADLIAQYPARRRSDSRMLVIHRQLGRWEDSRFRRLPEYLRAGDVLALNNSRVLPARLLGHRAGVRSQPIGKRNPKRQEYLTSEIEALLVRPLDERTWEALVRPGRKVRSGEWLVFEKTAPAVRSATGKNRARLEAEVVGRGEFGLRTLRFTDPESLARNLQQIGHVPLPPYIRRPDETSDRRRYQTVYAKLPGSVAAPTAGLHFTKPILAAVQEHGIELAEITLHVSLGTFQPIHEADVSRHRLHPESFSISQAAAATLNQALEDGRRIIAVGTTTVRTLEQVASLHGGRIAAVAGETELFIHPGFSFRAVGGLLTNFHLPRTTLLMLVAAFAGRKLILGAYEHAVRERYRFYSYGDCMLIL